MGVTVTGVQGALQWGYYVAGTLRAWTVTKTDEGWTLSASVQHLNTFRVTRRPLVFVVTHTKGVWRWPVLELQIAGTALSASLGPPET